MSEILDPRLVSSMLPELAISRRARNLVENPSFRSELSDENIDSLAEGALAITTVMSRADLRINYAFMLASRHVIHELMGDRLGRSEYHIAGEVCRILNLTRLIIFEEEIDDLSALRPASSPRPIRVATWRPYDVAMDCPTVDGHIATGYRPTTNREGTFYQTRQTHPGWLEAFLGAVLPSEEGDFLTRLQPPFVLTSGEIVAEHTPSYYIAHGYSSNAESTLPATLVDA